MLGGLGEKHISTNSVITIGSAEFKQLISDAYVNGYRTAKADDDILSNYPEIMDINDVASVLKCTRKTVYNRIESKKLCSHIDNNGKTFFLKKDIRQYLKLK